MAIEIQQTSSVSLLAELIEHVQSLHQKWYPKRFKEYNREGAITFFEETLSKPNVTAFIAVENENVLGYVLLFEIIHAENPFQFEHRYLLIDQIVVVEQARNKGVGKALMDASIAFAKEKKLETVELNRWNLNETAHQFFTNYGFKANREYFTIEL